MKNFIFRHQEQNCADGSAVENFYLNQSSDNGGIIKLQMFIDSKWHKFRSAREVSGSTAFIGLVLSGNQLRGENILHPGDVVIERSRSQQLASSTLADDILHRLVLIICRTPAFDLLTQTLFPENQSIIRGGGTGEIREIFQQISEEAAGQGDEKKISVLIFQLLQSLSLRCRNKKLPPPLTKALEFIRKQGFQPLLRQNIARAAGVSERKLNDLFREFMDQTPAQYLIERRIDFAKELLASNKFTVSETARMAGFSSTEFFIRVFRQATGTTPGKWIASR